MYLQKPRCANANAQVQDVGYAAPDFRSKVKTGAIKGHENAENVWTR